VIIPTECEYFSLRGLALLTDTVAKVHDRLNPKLSISGILITRFDPRTVNAREVMARVLERFGDLVFDTVITRTVRFPETSVAGPWGELHDTPGVWIGDGSAFPTPSGTNPMVSIMVLAERTADQILAAA